MTAQYERIGIIGAGAWGTALTTVARQRDRDVVIWARESVVVDAINDEHRNTMFLPETPLDPQVRATSDLAEASDVDAALLVVPGQFLRGVCESLAPHWQAGVPAVICTKGIEEDSCALMTEVVAAALPQAPQAVLSGPTFAAEVAKGLPTAVTIACQDDTISDALTNALGSATFRTYRSNDLVGAEIGGAVKNVLAIACGIVTGREFGSNARAALITRGLVEMHRLGEAKGAQRATLWGLCGLGDLVLTCSSEQSRNMSLGAALGRGERFEDIMASRRSVAEGVFNARAVVKLALELAIDMPICEAVNAILHDGATIEAEIEKLLARPMGDELA
ncbi:MAG: glycerol-3-phosphate acyltransferase [Alphaproteobacteria bacterium]|nr:glycerol-3-phosphate acyltransferase [Alphaproteobacteria bacterium]|tara:strand:+ start:2430 stop:3434 length:1005 start_codon:yes stop_codon:yes gene_type:complete